MPFGTAGRYGWKATLLQEMLPKKEVLFNQLLSAWIELFRKSKKTFYG